MDQIDQGNRPPRQELTLIKSTPPRNQLAQLGASFKPAEVRNLLANVINTGEPNVIQVSAALANNNILDSVLANTAAYKHAPEGVTPAADFNSLSVGTSEQAASALARLTAGFFEARTVLAQNYDESNSDLMNAFEIVNGAYALVISTSHKLFDKDPSYRKNLRPEFLNLLGTDPFLEKLIPSFRDLHETKSSQAKKIALRTFFENFCENAVEPYVYNKDFSALIQSILLRELRHVIMEESKSPVSQRILAPYLANLFEKRMRGELETARTKDGKDQPVLDSLRDCPGEGKHLMRAVTDFLIESLGDSDDKIILKHEDLISCEVMLSIGCLLPETGLTELLGTRLRQVEDLSPSLILVFSSALKFSLYIEHSNHVPTEFISIDPRGLVEFGFKIAKRLSEKEGERLVAEVFLPLANDFTTYANENLDKWKNLPDKIRDLCVNQVLLQKILEWGQKENTEADPNSVSLHDMAEILSLHTEDKFKLDPLGARWLVLQGAEGKLSENQIRRILKYTISDGTEAEKLGVDPEIYDALLSRGGFNTIKILASLKGSEERLGNQLAAFHPENNEEATEMRKIFFDKLVDPLRLALREYGNLVQARRESEMASMGAGDKRNELLGCQVKITKLQEHIRVCRGALEEIVDFIKLEKEYQDKIKEIKLKQDKLASLEGMTTKQLVEQDKVGMPENLKRNIERLENERDLLLTRHFKLPSSVLKELPELGRTSMNLAELMRMEAELVSTTKLIATAESELNSALNGVQTSMEGMSERRKEIKRLFAIVQKAAESECVKGIQAEKLSLIREGSFDPLGIFCRINLAAQINAGKPLEEGKVERLKLEADVKKCLEASFKDLFSKEDSRLVLTGIAELVQRGGSLLSDWETGETSLPAFLKSKILKDCKNDALAWMNHEPGWDESLHAPILRIFAAMAVSKVVATQAKTEAIGVVFSVVRHWVNREKEIRRDEQEIGESKERSITVEDLYRPWTSLLHLTHGKVKIKGNNSSVVAITEFLTTEAIKEVPSATYTRLKDVLNPFRTNLLLCQKDADSSLSPLPESALNFCSAVSDRIVQLSNLIKAQKQRIEKAAPKPAVAEGISFDDLKVPNGLSLPPPRGETRDMRRLIERRKDT